MEFTTLKPNNQTSIVVSPIPIKSAIQYSRPPLENDALKRNSDAGSGAKLSPSLTNLILKAKNSSCGQK